MDESGDAFAIPDLWKTSTLADFSQSPNELSTLNLEPFVDLLNSQEDQFGIHKSLDLHLPDLSTFTYGPLEELSAPDASSTSSSPVSFDIPETLEVDIWSPPESDENEKGYSKFKSWETFYDKDFKEPRNVYISEGGPQIFDAFLDAEDWKSGEKGSSPRSGHVLRSGPLLASLLQLGLGRESLLYRYSREQRTFHPSIEDGRMSGYSFDTFNSLSSTFIECGTKTLELQSFIDGTQTSSKPFPALIALAGSFSTILATLQAQIGHASASIRSLLQLQSLFEKPQLVLTLLRNIIRKVEKANRDEELLSRLYEVVQESEHIAPWLRPMLLQIFALVSKPWLESSGSWLGLKEDSIFENQGLTPNFVKVTEEARKAEGGRVVKVFEYEFEPLSMPDFIAAEDARTIFETGRHLRLLKAHQPEHPLLRPALISATETPHLDWQFSWDQIEKVQVNSSEYNLNLQKAITDFDLHGRITTIGHHGPKYDEHNVNEDTGLSEETAKAYIRTSITNFEKPLPILTDGTGDKPSYTFSLDKCGITEISGDEIFAPPISLLPVLSFNPLVSIQARLINRACLHFLFKEHSLRSHFSILHRYSLFGDGVFASRLSHALFDPELPTAERRKGRPRRGTSGLKLGSRDTWPPASSELRLSLMGILTDSFYDTRVKERASLSRDELPGGLSFAIREMSEVDLERCMNPNSIEALDFLRLQYEPPAPLDAVITSGSLLKYDAIFKLLLRAVRSLFVVNQLFQDTRARRTDYISQRFRIESHHFVSAICGYLFDGVQANWSTLERRLNEVERALDRDGDDSLSSLRDFHEQMLDRMMFALIIRKRQAQVMKLLEEIFGSILQFARHVRSEASGLSLDADSKTDVQQTYEKFKKKVRIFITVCRGLSERREQGGTIVHEASHDLSGNEDMREEGGNTIGQLLLKLEMSGFYAR